MTNKNKISIALAIAVVIILCGLMFVIMNKEEKEYAKLSSESINWSYEGQSTTPTFHGTKLKGGVD